MATAKHRATAKKRARKAPTTTRRASGRAGSSARSSPRYWSANVTRRSNALDLKPDVFTSRAPHKIAVSLKRSAEASKRREAVPYRSAMSMLTFYINRAGKTLPKAQRDRLERAKGELKRQFGRD